MAQIVTITNPLTGQPAQVDQLDHTAQEIDDAIARALPGGAIDTALQNKAPAGYGLGGEAKELSSSDNLNSITSCGWYKWDTEPENGPGIANGTMIVLNGVWGCVMQIVYDPNGFMVQRACYYNTWKPWEWENPPMFLAGVDADGNVTNEYRTTERYLGKPVYAIAYDYGNLPDSSAISKTVEGVKNADKVVSVFGYTTDGKTIPTFNYGWGSISTLSDAIALDAYADPTIGLKINIATMRNQSSAKAVVIVKYTKSTD